MITAKRVSALLAESEANVLALRRVLAMCNGHARTVKAERFNAVIGEAVELDGKRRIGQRGPDKKPRRSAMARGAVYAETMEKRRRTGRVLELLAEKGPMAAEDIIQAIPIPIGWFAPVARRGYVRQLASGKWKRTSKAFSVERPAKAAG